MLLDLEQLLFVNAFEVPVAHVRYNFAVFCTELLTEISSDSSISPELERIMQNVQ